METKDDLIEELDNKIEKHKGMIKHNISYLIEALNEMDGALYIISYLSYLKDDFIKKDGV